ncbi:hypothetical protein SDC9_108546 [bioreactor metagenome]|uniref:Uncharacterized protein n=1 Tax=bioreactor metagenome TaxID=1076179 RepID=A0A645B9G8_9ZZZZ
MPVGQEITALILVSINKLLSMADSKCITIYAISDSGISFISIISLMNDVIFSIPLKLS